MEASPLPTGSIENWTEQFDQTLRAQRDRVREFLATQQQRLRGAEDALGQQLDDLARLLADDRAETRQTRKDLQHRGEQLAHQTETLETLRADLDRRRAEWDQLREQSDRQHRALAEQIARGQQELDRRGAELDRRREELDRDRAELDQHREEIEKRRAEIDRRRPQVELAEAELERSRHEFQLKSQQLEADREQLESLRRELDTRRAELDRRHEELDARESDTQSTRRRIAREFRDRHAAELRELDRRRAELERRDAAEQEDLRRRLETAGQREAELREELDGLRAAHARLREQLAEQVASGIDEDRFRGLQTDRDALAARVAEVEERLAQEQLRHAESNSTAAESDDEYHRRYELAMDDLRELKAENAELRQQLAREAPAGPQKTSPPAAGGALNWEAEKQRILAALEEGFDDRNEDDRGERLKIENVVQRTDAIIAEKDREIAELQQLLEQQAGSVGSLAVGAAALGEVLDADAMIQEERENLKRLQEACHEKLRQAEIDVSVERAKLARQRREIEEKLRILENEATAKAPSADGEPSSARPASGRWLHRLGLSARDEDAK